jgi:RNA polymerase sigma-70 factor, ECF subfamily
VIDYLECEAQVGRPGSRCQPGRVVRTSGGHLWRGLDRLARAYEADPDNRRDLLQEIHFALWRSFEHFAQRCSLRTCVYQVAHNTAASHVVRQRRTYAGLVSLEEIETMPVRQEDELAADRRTALEQLLRLIQRLKPLDRQVILSYLEGMDAASIGEITGISPANAARIQTGRPSEVR